MTYTLRTMAEPDRDVVADLWHVGWVEAHAAYVPKDLIAQRTRDSFHIRLLDMIASTTVAVMAEAVVGFCATKPDEIYQIYVDASARGTGVAAALIADGEARLKAAGTTEAYLDVILENDRAIAFYRKQGWTDGTIETAQLDTLGDPFPLTLRRMRKPL